MYVSLVLLVNATMKLSSHLRNAGVKIKLEHVLEIAAIGLSSIQCGSILFCNFLFSFIVYICIVIFIQVFPFLFMAILSILAVCTEKYDQSDYIIVFVEGLGFNHTLIKNAIRHM